MKAINTATQLLLIIGGLNWLLVGAFGFDLVATIFGMSFGQRSALSSAVYVLVGLSAIYQAAQLAFAPRTSAAPQLRRTA